MSDGLALKRLAALLIRLQGRRAIRRLARIRPLRAAIREADEAEYRELERAFFPEAGVTGYGEESQVNNLVARRCGRTAGFVQLVRQTEGEWRGTYWLSSLWIKTRFRGRGLGERLCGEVIRRARDQGARELFLKVQADNPPAVQLYRKLGFIVQEEKTGEIIMKKAI